MGKSDELRVQIRSDEVYIWGLFTKESCRIRRNNAYCCDGCVLYTRRENTTWIIEQAGMMQVVQRYYRRIKNARRAKFCKLNEKSVMLVQFRYSTNSLYKLPPSLLCWKKIEQERMDTPITKKSKGILLFFNLIKRTIPQNYLILVTRRFLYGRKNEKKENKNSLSWWYFPLRRGEKKKRKVPFSNRSMELRSLREREREKVFDQ